MQQKVRFPAGAILLIVGVVLSIANIFLSVKDVLHLLPATYWLERLLFWIPYIALAVVLLIKKRELPLTITAAAGALLLIIGMVLPLTRGAAFTFSTAMSLLPIIAFVLVALMGIPSLKVMRKLWFLPGIVMALYLFSPIITRYLNAPHLIGEASARFLIRILSDSLMSMLVNTLYLIGFFLIGGWLARPFAKPPVAPRPAYQPQAPVNAYRPPVQPQPPVNAYRPPVQPQAPVNAYQPPVQPASPAKPAATSTDELIRYKELLDNGAITQEEFDAIKKRILGL